MKEAEFFRKFDMQSAYQRYVTLLELARK